MDLSLWMPRLLEAGLVLAMAWQLASIGVSHAPTADRGLSEPVQAAATLPDLKTVAAIPLFGRVPVAVVRPKVVKPKPRPVVVAPSRLNIQLLGTVVAGARSSAILKMAGDKEKVVFIGKRIKPGIILKKVEIYAVVVDNHGSLERVTMANHKKGQLGTVAPQIHHGRVITHRFSRRVIQNKMKDMSKLLTGALAVPHQTNGKADGFLIQSIVPGSLYALAGLKNGDLLRSVNGQPVTTLQQGIALFQKLKDLSSIDAEIMRAGTIQQLHFDIK